MTERNPRKRIHSYITKTRFLHLEDALDIGKIRLFVGQYRKGNGASATAFHFLDLADARVLFADLAWAKPVDFTDYKGTSNGDGPQSRVLKINGPKDKNKVWLEVQNGPGEIVGQGAVKPAGKPDAQVSVPLSTWEARKLAHAALAYVRAWEARHLLATAPTASPMVTEPAHQVAAAVTTGQDVGAIPRDCPTIPRVCPEATATAFWTLYNETAKPAGVPYPHAQNIASKHGDADDWQTAIERLHQAIAKT